MRKLPSKRRIKAKLFAGQNIPLWWIAAKNITLPAWVLVDECSLFLKPNHRYWLNG